MSSPKYNLRSRSMNGICFSILISVVAFFILTVDLFSQDVHYVRESGDDLNSGLAPDQAWRTLEHATLNVDPGDTIFIGAGDYDEWLLPKVSGYEGEEICWIGDIDGARTGDDGEVRVSALVMDYDMSAYRGYPDSRSWNGDYNYIYRIHFLNTMMSWNFGERYSAVFQNNGTNDFHVICDGCRFDDTVHSYNGWAEGIQYLSFYNCTFGENVDLNKDFELALWKFEGEVLDEPPTYPYFELYNCTFYAPPYPGDGMDNKYFRTLWQLQCSGAPAKMTIRNCIFYVNDACGFLDYQYGLREGEPGSVNYWLDSDHNVFYFTGDFASHYRIWTDYPLTFIPDLNAWRVEHNLDLHSIEADPRFIDLSPVDFHLRPNSPCRGSGENLYDIIKTDADLNERDSISFDVGAYAFMKGRGNHRGHRKLEISEENDILIYPNPTNSTLNIVGNGNRIDEITIYNLLGQVERIYRISGKDVNIGITDLVSGIHFISLTRAGQQTIEPQKIIIIK